MSNQKLDLYIYKGVLKSPKNIENILDPAELGRYEKMTNEKRRSEFLTSRFLLKSILRQFYDLDSVQIKQSKNGKPFVKGIKFNLSHSENVFVFAMTKKTEIGVDIEFSSRVKYFKEIASQYFSQNEYEYIFRTKKESDQIKRFSALWSLKEAYIKANDGFLNSKSIRIFFDLREMKIQNLPKKKQVSFFIHQKSKISICAMGLVFPRQFKIYTLSAEYFDSTLKRKKSSLKFVRLTKPTRHG
jgi:phosphopantetheine--protein transferase-like protein